MILTPELLARHGACAPESHGLFLQWPDGVEPTGENINTAREAGLPWYWLPQLLSAEGLSAFIEWCRATLAEAGLLSEPRIRDTFTMLDAGDANRGLLAQHLIISWLQVAEDAEAVGEALCNALGVRLSI